MNVHGRLFDAFTNKTFTNDYSITVYEGHGGQQVGKSAYEKLDYYGSTLGDFYTGFYELVDLTPGAYIAIAEAKGYSTNFQKFYALSQLEKLRSFPMVPYLEEGQLGLVLTWGNFAPRDLDIHVEFIAAQDILCEVDYSMRACGGVRYMSDTIQGGNRGADAVKFEKVGDYQYLVYVSLFKHRSSPKASNQTLT